MDDKDILSIIEKANTHMDADESSRMTHENAMELLKVLNVLWENYQNTIADLQTALEDYDRK